MVNILDLEPKTLWRYFNDICGIPRSSKKEEKIRDYIIGKAKSWGLDYEVDKIGNIVIRKKPTVRTKSESPVILQGHMDMVCEKDPGVAHDCLKDPIKPIVDGEWVRAEGTSLGGDNGIGIAACVAVMESTDLSHGPLEILLTVDEETGLHGAKGLKEGFVKGQTLINMDSEEDGELYIGCSGDETFSLEFGCNSINTTPRNCGLKIDLIGLQGGHSGLDIHLQRGNAIKLLARLISYLKGKYNIGLSGFEGGSKSNAIPRNASAAISLNEQEEKKIREAISDFERAVKEELGDVASQIEIRLETIKIDKELKTEDFSRIINFINVAPHGVISKNPYIKDLVQTSCNLAIASVDVNGGSFIISCRSSVPSEGYAVKAQIRSLAGLAGAELEVKDYTPGWKPNLNSKVVRLMEKTCSEIYGNKPELKAMHACLECGVIAEKFPYMDMVSFGPRIENCHSTSERVNIESVGRFWKLLVRTLEKLAS